MKITLNASIKEHREIAELFRGCDNEGWIFVGACVNLFWLTNSSEYEDSFVHHEDIKEDRIIIDLDTAKMDLRMALGTEIEFLSFKNSFLGTTTRYFRGYFAVSKSDWWYDAEEIKLCPDYLKSVGVEIEE